MLSRVCVSMCACACACVYECETRTVAPLMPISSFCSGWRESGAVTADFSLAAGLKTSQFHWLDINWKVDTFLFISSLLPHYFPFSIPETLRADSDVSSSLLPLWKQPLVLAGRPSPAEGEKHLRNIEQQPQPKSECRTTESKTLGLKSDPKEHKL